MLTHYSQLKQNGQCGANMIVAVFDDFSDIFVEVRILFDNYYTNFGGNTRTINEDTNSGISTYIFDLW